MERPRIRISRIACPGSSAFHVATARERSRAVLRSMSFRAAASHGQHRFWYTQTETVSSTGA